MKFKDCSILNEGIENIPPNTNVINLFKLVKSEEITPDEAMDYLEDWKKTYGMVSLGVKFDGAGYKFNSNKVLDVLIKMQAYNDIAWAGRAWENLNAAWYKKATPYMLKSDNMNIIWCEEYWKNFPYEEALDTLIDNAKYHYKPKDVSHPGDYIREAGDDWKKFDYEKGLDALIELKDGKNIFFTGRMWKKFDYEKALDALIELKDSNNILYAARDWKKFNYKKALEALKLINKKDYNYAVKNWKGKY